MSNRRQILHSVGASAFLGAPFIRSVKAETADVTG